MTEPGTLSHGVGGALRISVDAEHYRIKPEDEKSLLLYGRIIPIVEVRSRMTREGTRASESQSRGVRRARFGCWVAGNLLWLVYASAQENGYMMTLFRFYWGQFRGIEGTLVK